MIALTRSKGASSPQASSAPLASSGPDLGEPNGLASIEAAAALLEEVQSADEVVEALVSGMAPAGARLLVLAVRGGLCVGRSGSGPLRDSAAAKAVAIAISDSRVIQQALREGFYLGYLPDDAAHAELLRVLEHPRAEVALQVVYAAGREVLVLVTAGFDNSYLLTRRMDQLARAAGRALDRLLGRA